MTQMYYFVADFDRIQRYIFETNKLREMLGASALVAQVTNWGVKDALLHPDNRFGKGNLKLGTPLPEFDEAASIGDASTEWELIYADGGNVKALFKRTDLADRFDAIMRRLFHESLGAGAGTFTSVIRSFAPNPEGFARVVKDAGVDLKIKKAGKSEQLNAVSAPFFRICSSCGHREAEREGDKANEWLCQVCYLKRRKGEQSSSFSEFHGALVREFRQLRPDSPLRELMFLMDFEELPGESKNFLGIVVIDGNRMGEVVDRLLARPCGTLGEQTRRLRRFSIEATKLSYHCVARAVAEVFKDDLHSASQDLELAFRPIILGGDDIVFVLRADRALQVAELCCEYLKGGTKELQKRGVYPCEVSFAAGVMIVKKGFPFFASHALAEDLVRSGKRKNREILQNEKGDFGTLDFQVLTSSDISSLASIRGRVVEYRDSLTGAICRLTGKPYLLGAGSRPDDFKTVVGASQNLFHTLPRNKQQALRGAVRQGEVNSRMHLAHIMMRLDKGKQEIFAREVLWDEQIWRDGEVDGRTVKINQFLDMLELIEFY
jgi:hypothetical protein